MEYNYINLDLNNSTLIIPKNDFKLHAITLYNLENSPDISEELFYSKFKSLISNFLPDTNFDEDHVRFYSDEIGFIGEDLPKLSENGYKENLLKNNLGFTMLDYVYPNKYLFAYKSSNPIPYRRNNGKTASMGGIYV